MNFPHFYKVEWVSFLKKLLVFFLFFYGVVLTGLLYRWNPQPILIGVDSFGTHLITEQNERLLKKEKENLIKHFLFLFYTFDAQNYSDRISETGDLMSSSLWENKKAEFLKMKEKIKDDPIAQYSEIQELRQVDDLTFQADLGIRIQRKLTEVTFKLRTELQLKAVPRSQKNPYPYEVNRYEEQKLEGSHE